MLTLVAAIGLVQACGWWWQDARIVTFWPGEASTSFSTAVLLVLAAAATASLFFPVLKRAWIPLAVAIAVIAIAAVVDTALGTGWALDALVRDFSLRTGLSSNTSTYTATAFVLVALTISLRAFCVPSRWRLTGGLLGVVVTAIGLGGLFTHALRVFPETSPAGLGALASATALGLTFLGATLTLIEAVRYERGGYVWAPPMAGTLAGGVTLVIWQALQGRYLVVQLSAFAPRVFLAVGITFTLLITFSSYFALVARRNLGLLRNREADLRRLNAELEAKVLERTRELEITNVELDRFSSIAAHDLKSPLNSMVQFAQLLHEEADGRLLEEERQWISAIILAGARARRLIDALLELARTGKTALHLEILDANQIVRAAQENLHFDILRTHADVKAQGLPEIRGDKVQLLQLFQNLLGNAIKYQQKGERPIVRVDVREVAGEWRFAVTDNGIGIEPGNVDAAFTYFTRFRTGEQYQGTGLGLAMCRRIVENHAGRIWLESVVGQGTTVFFTLPAVEN